MIQVRTKDRIFLGVVLPCVLLFGYAHFVREPQQKRIRALAAEHQNLPDVDLFPAEKMRLEKRLQDARADLAAARAEKEPELCVKGDPTATAATRQDAIVARLASAGGRVVRIAPPASETPDEQARGGAVLQATGRCPAPEARIFTIEADYAAFVSFLKTCASEQVPVVPEGVSMTPGGRTCRWEMTLWL